MKRFLVIFVVSLSASISMSGQTAKYQLGYYLEKAFQNSPFQADLANRKDILKSESQYLKNVYTHSRILLEGNCLFVPIISKDNGQTSFRWDAQSADDYYGYDLGVSSGNIQYGVTWSQPLLGNSVYKAAESQLNVQQEILKNDLKITLHDLERNVTDQYILCMLDRNQIDWADSVCSLLSEQADCIVRLADAGQAKQSDVELIRIEQQANKEMKTACEQSYYNHLMELNALCCIRDTATVDLDRVEIEVRSRSGGSQFLTKYYLDSLNTVASQSVFETKYKPQLNFFTDFGMRTVSCSSMYRNFGMSAGLSFSFLLSDGRLREIKRHETGSALASVSIFKHNLQMQNQIRLRQCSAAIRDYEERIRLLDAQVAGYDRLLVMCQKEIRAGQMSVFDYITTLKNIISVQRQKMEAEADRELAVNAYNYFNW